QGGFLGMGVVFTKSAQDRNVIRIGRRRFNLLDSEFFQSRNDFRREIGASLNKYFPSLGMSHILGRRFSLKLLLGHFQIFNVKKYFQYVFIRRESPTPQQGRRNKF